MRNAFAKQLHTLAADNDKLVLLSGDIGNRLFDPFKNEFAERFFNCGVAEANMIGVAAGMAMCGLRPVVYTIIPFVTARCLEQIRVDICYHQQPVIIVGVGAGLSYANLGATHHACEDLAMMRSLPNMRVVCPADAAETSVLLRDALESDQPTYIRIGKKGEPAVHATVPNCRIGFAYPLSGDENPIEIALLANGTTLPQVQAAAKVLNARGAATSVTSFHTIKPLDTDYLTNVFCDPNIKLVCTIEEHSLVGGFGAAVAEWKADHSAARAPLLRIGLPDSFFCRTGSPSFARQQLGLDADGLVQQILAACDSQGIKWPWAV